MSELSPLEFERVHRGARPVVIVGGARQLPAFTRWNQTYLVDHAGAAVVDVSHYRAERGDYDDISRETTTLRAFIESLADRSAAAVAYLFPNASCVFARNEQRAELHTGWAAGVNPGLALLAADFALPQFVRSEDFVLASLIMGSSKNATDLHYDWGGESKVLVQLRGRKRITLMSPAAASALQLYSMYDDDPTRAPKERNPSRGRAAMTPALAERVAPHTFETELGEGDLIYWPGFWFHEVTNLDEESLAVSVFLDEVHLDPLQLRLLLFHTFNAFKQLMHAHLEGAQVTLTDVARMEVTYMDLPFIGLLELFSEYEAFLLSEACSTKRNLWAWNSTQITRR